MENQQQCIENAHLKQIISIGIADGNFVLIGFPYDEGNKRVGRKPGVDYGPDCFRRFLDDCGPLINPEYALDLSKLTIKDYGNIDINEIENQTLENYLQKLCIKIGIVKYKYKSIPIIIGGSFDQTYACYQSLFESNCKNIGIICIDSTFHLEEKKEITSQNCIRKFLAQFSQNQENKQLKLYYFGIKQESKKKRDELQTLKEISKEFNNISIELISFEQIRETQLDFSQVQNLFLPRTKAGISFKKLLQQLTDFDEIHLSLNLESMKSQYCPGISYQNQEGFISEEICEIFLLAGQDQKITGIDISGFNPVIEDFITGRLLVNILYYFIMGTTKRY